MRRMQALIFFTAALISIWPAAARKPPPIAGYGFYQSTDGQRVHKPTKGVNPAYRKVTATCRDGLFPSPRFS